MLRRGLLIIAALVVAAVAGTWFYINVIREDAPDRLVLEDDRRDRDAGGPEPTVPPELDGTWVATSESAVGYRVKEVIFGQDTEGVGRTNEVTGEIVIEGRTVTEARFEADLRGLKSDEAQRDGQVQDRILDTARFPTATFALTEPISFSVVPTVGDVFATKATGDLTIRGTTKSVTFDLQAKRSDTGIEVAGAIPIVFAEWGIPNPSNFVAATEDRGLLEFLLVLEAG